MGGQLCKRKLEQQSQMSQYVRRGDWPFVLPISCYHLCLPSITWCHSAAQCCTVLLLTMSPHHLNTEAPQTCYWPAYQLYTNHMIQHIWTISCILEWTGVFKVLHYLVQTLFVLQKLELFFGRPLLPDPANPANGPLSRPDVSICTFSTKLHNHSPPAGG